MTNFEFGTVVLIHFPQSEVSTRKQRPGIVLLDVGDLDIVIAPITSRARSSPGDMSLVDLKGAGLIRPSWVRLGKVATLLKTDVLRLLGRVSSAERMQLAQTWQTLYGDLMS
jgi:mRNA interferase MazF